MSRWSDRVTRLVLGTFVLGLSTGAHCPKPPDPPKGEITEFGVAPGQVCVNLVTLIRVSWQVKAAGRHCMTLDANGIILLSAFEGPPTGVQDGRCDEGEWEREVGFDLRTVFGANIPSTVTVTAKLMKASGVTETETVDTASADVTTLIDCQPGFVPR